MARHAEVFVGAAGGVGELQRMRLEAVSMSWTVWVTIDGRAGEKNEGARKKCSGENE